MPKGVRLMGVSFSNLQFADELLGRQLNLEFLILCSKPSSFKSNPFNLCG